MQNRYLSDIINFDPENDLEHHGVMGMKWGIRRYQPYSLIPRKSGKGGKLLGDAKKKTSSGKTTGSSSKKSRNQKSADAKAAVEKQAKTARQRKEELEKVVNSGDAKLVYEHRHELTKKQLDTAIDRINTEARVASLVQQQNPSKLNKLKQLARSVDDVNSVVRTGVNAYKTVNEISKLYGDAKKAKSAREKADISAKALDTLIKNGSTSIEDIKKVQSVLTDSDLATAAKRTTSLNTIDNNDYNLSKRDRTRRQEREGYLQKSVADLRSAQDADEEVSNFYSKMASNSDTSAYDSYVDSQVSKKRKRKNNKLK